MMRLPEPIRNLVEYFDRLPGIGPKTAEKLVFYLLKQQKNHIQGFSAALQQLHDSLGFCQTCHNFASQTVCTICSDAKRDTGLICVVSETHDLAAIEQSGEFNGVYHVLGGTINPLEGITAEMLNVSSLLDRIAKNRVKEVVLAFDADFEGEATVLYLQKALKPFNGLTLTRLAQGLPMGSVVEYADEVTLAKALRGRTNV